jgi:NAD(P)H dehydrogenase (quinone)
MNRRASAKGKRVAAMSDTASVTPRHTVILANPSRDSFDAALAHHYCNSVQECGQDAAIHDLYAMGFDPILKDDERPGTTGYARSPDVSAEIGLLQGSQVIVLVYPIWFGMPPAIMKGYVDRVLGAGVTPGEIMGHAGQGVLTGGRLLSITTSGASEIWLDEEGQIDALRHMFSGYLAEAFSMKSVDYLHFGGIVEGLSQNFADQYLRDVHDRARLLCATVAADTNSPAR